MCILLGITMVVLSIGFAGVAWFSIGLEQMRAAMIGLPVLSLFCLAGAAACLVPASRPITLRLVGGAVFLAFLGYLIHTGLGGPLWSSSRSTPSLLGAIAAFSTFGLPGGYVAIKGQYPRWGKYFGAFVKN
jgi:hypothetical protein